MAYREIVQKFKNLVSQLNDTIKFNFFLQMQFYLHNYFDEIGNNTDDSHEEYIQKILELYINTCQRIRFESMSSRKIMQYHSLSRCWWKRMQILSVTAAINIYVVVVWPIWAWNLIRKHGFPSIAKCMVTKIKDIS